MLTAHVEKVCPDCKATDKEVHTVEHPTFMEVQQVVHRDTCTRVMKELGKLGEVYKTFLIQKLMPIKGRNENGKSSWSNPIYELTTFNVRALNDSEARNIANAIQYDRKLELWGDR